MVRGRSGIHNIPSISTTPRIIARTKDCTPLGAILLSEVQQPCTGPCARAAASTCVLLRAIVSLTVKQQQKLHIYPSCGLHGLSLCPNKVALEWGGGNCSNWYEPRLGKLLGAECPRGTGGT